MDVASEGQAADREQAAAFAKKAVEQNELQRGRRDPYQGMMGLAVASHRQVTT
jgi:hypothetical protein